MGTFDGGIGGGKSVHVGKHIASEIEIASARGVRDVGVLCRHMMAKLRELPDVDLRWLAIAETHLQQGLMAAARAIEKPATF